MRPTSLVSLLMIDQLQGLPATAGAIQNSWQVAPSGTAAPLVEALLQWNITWSQAATKILPPEKTCKTWGRTLAQEFSAWSATEQVHPLLATQNAKDHMRGSSIKHWLLPNINAEIINGPQPSEKASSAASIKCKINLCVYIYIYICIYIYIHIYIYIRVCI